MGMSSWLAFLFVSLAATFSPGPGVLLAISTSFALGPRRTLYSSAGNALGVVIVAMIAVTSVGMLLQTSPLAFVVLKTLGAGYLVYLGVRQWLQKASQVRIGSVNTPPLNTSRFGVFSRGLLVALTNPKAILFFTAIFPQFMPDKGVDLVRFLLLTSTFVVCVMISHLCYILLAARLGGDGVDPSIARLINRMSGFLFVGLGVLMLSM
nr:LysE family translocator [uncultured Undibacterium sp.]